MKKKKKKKKRENGNPLDQQILELIDSRKSKKFSVRAIMRALNLKNKKAKNLVETAIAKMTKQGAIQQDAQLFYSTQHQHEIYDGIVDHVSPRFAYVVCDDLDEDVWVSTSNLKGALHGDKVKVEITSNKNNQEGSVVNIIERSKKEIVGTIEISENFAFVRPDSRKLHQDIFVPLQHVNKAQSNDKVIVEIKIWPYKNKKPEGVVKKVLGKAGLHNTEMHAILIEYDLPTSYPSHLVKEAEKISETITESEIKKRKDFRDVLTFTIDPDDAKDFDDALSIRALENGNWEIGIHIADVTHYIHENDKLEKEAYERATSIYLVDRVVPMLPERLSNYICSLRPNEDKLTFSAVFELDDTGKIHNYWLGRTIIHSKHRFTYDEAQNIIENQEGLYVKELTQLNQIAKNLREERFKNGAISFETLEVKFELDPEGKPLSLVPKIRKDAHKLVEEYMLLANRQVASHVYHLKKQGDKLTMVYRTHDYPDPLKIENFSKFASKLGYKIATSKNKFADSVNQMTEDVEGKSIQNSLQSLAIRTMAKAKYSTEPEGHFGLGFEFYTHFTSPIRRYPDMMVHRLLAHYLAKGKNVDQDAYEEKCQHATNMEKKAADAERASIKYKQIEYMMTKDQDKVYEGVITGLSDFGIFVELIETKCEGMIRMSELSDDYYEHDADNYRVVGKKTGKTFSFGGTINVKIKEINLMMRTMDLTIA